MEASGSSDKLALRIVREIADFQFGRNVGSKLFPDECDVKLSKRTGRPRYVLLEGRLLATIRYPDNMIALTPEGALRLKEVLGERAPRVVLRESGVRRVSRGMNPVAGDLLYSSDGIRPGEDVLIESRDGRLLAVGRAIVSSRIMKDLEAGAIVKVRKVFKT